MNKTKSLALFDQGCDAWNAWANELLAERRKLEASGEWSEDHVKRAWQETAAANFSGYEFEDIVKFSGFIFPGRADFSKAAFLSYADFSKAAFKGSADFSEAAFKGSVDFSEAAFKGDAIFSEAAFSGGARFSEAAFLGYADFSKAAFPGSVDFIKAAFSGSAGFIEAAFKDYAMFNEAAFSDYAMFNEAAFSGYAGFIEAAFKGDAIFSKAAFSDDAEFGEAAFKGSARFQKAVFSKTARFMQTSFDGLTYFDNCLFKGDTNYRAAQVSRTFLLSGARFEQTPNFIQARFAEAPSLHDIHIKSQSSRVTRLASVKALLKDDAELAARWRALKKLSVAAHDHDSELRFFKGEVFAKRRLFFVGLLYSLFSDFGRSALRPLLLWALGVFGFAWCYFSQAGGRWADVLNWSLPCDAGTGNAVTAALGLSLRNALLLPGGGSAARLDQIYACLYGIHDSAAGELPARLRLVIPDAVAFAGVMQSLLSAVMIFLLLLALRNHFRIK